MRKSFFRETTIENNQFFQNYKHSFIIKFDQIKLLRVPLLIKHCHVCMEGHMKLRLKHGNVELTKVPLNALSDQI